MYNHYIPQSDGSYRRSTMPEGSRKQPSRPQQNPHQQKPSAPPPPPPAREPPRQEEPECKPQPETSPQVPCTPARNDSILSFLRGLLPREIDATDLLVILILLLMNKEDDCDGLSPMLTIALYFLL